MIRDVLGLRLSNLSLLCRQYERLMLLMLRWLVDRAGMRYEGGAYIVIRRGNPIWYGTVLLTKYDT